MNWKVLIFKNRDGKPQILSQIAMNIYRNVKCNWNWSFSKNKGFTSEAHARLFHKFYEHAVRYTLSIHAIESMADNEMAYELKQAIGN